MGKALNKETIKAYLLGRISDEETLAAIEEALFSDDDFAAEVELAEDEIINDYVFENLPAEDRKDAEGCFFKSSDRQFKLKLTEELKKKASLTGAAETSTFLEKLKAFFARPIYAGAFAVLLVAAIGLAIFFSRDGGSSELAELRDFYKKDRTVEPRITDFDYAPLNVTRGENEDRENQSKLRRMEIGLFDEAEKNPTAENRRALGVFYLTQRRFPDAVRELQDAAKLDDKNAKIANDLGSAYLETARNASGDKKTLAMALEQFRRAAELDPNLLEAFFNRSLCLQDLGLYAEAKESWNSYLEKDPNSGWADEARRNLERLENLKRSSKTREQILEDFLSAYHGENHELARKINCQTKEMLNEAWLPGQLTRRWLEAGRDERGKILKALKFIGDFEKTRNADFFVDELAEYYSNIGDSQIENLLLAKDAMRNGFAAIVENKSGEAVSFFDESAKLFSASGNIHEEKLAEFWSAQSKTRAGKIEESLAALNSLSKYFEAKNYKWLYGQTIYWISDNYFFQNEFTKTIDFARRSLEISRKIGDTYGEQKSIGELTAVFEKLRDSNEWLRYLAQMPDAKNLYYYSSKQAQRDNLFAGKLFYSLRLFAAAESFAKESLHIAKEISEKSDLKNGSLELLAQIYTKEKRFEEALNTARESQAIAKNKPDDSLKNYLIAKATLPVAELKRQMDRCEEALADYDSTIELYSQKSEIRVANFVAHKGKLLCFQTLGRREEMQSELQTVLDSAEQYRSQILKDDERIAFFDSEQFVYDVAVENALANGETSKAFELAESSKARSLLDFVAGKSAIADLEKQFPEVSKPLSLAEIQTRMSPNVQLVQFAVLPRKTVAWIVTTTEIKNAEIEISAEALQEKVSAYLKSIIGKAAKSETEKAGRELYDLLVSRIVSSLDPSKEICFIPDKSLHQLPFAALVSAKKKFLLEDFRVVYSPSASVFVFASEKAKALENVKDERVLSVGNPAFDKEKNANLPVLPAAEDEARIIGRFYSEAKIALGANATKSEFLSEMPGAEVIHFAGHYVAEPESPGNSRLLFSAGEESDLRSSEIAATKLPRAKLVVLSACQTGIEKFYEGEGAIGIARTFLAVGAPIVVASNWKVESESTKDLMIAFHQNRREKDMSASEALRRAQIDMLEDAKGNFREPYFWAAFSVIGATSNY